MFPFALITDSTIDETADYFTRNEIAYVPLSFTIDNRTIDEDCGQTMPLPEFFGLLRQGKMSITAQGQLEVFLSVFRSALQNGQDVLYIGFSSGLSGTFQAGCIARDELAPEFPDRKIICVDSLSATGGEYLLVDMARQMRDKGCSIDQTAKAVEEKRLSVIHLIAVNDLDFVHRGGRLSKTSAVVGGLFGIKPIIWINDTGTLGVGGKVRGRQKTIEYMCGRVANEMTDKNQCVRICHGDCEDDARVLSDLLLKRGISSDIRFIGTVIGSHTGPGMLSAFYFGNKRGPV